MLSQSAFNAFLKTLEEPPPYAIFILATTEKHKIIPTILSRCQIFDFRRIQIPDIVAHLENICKQEGIKAEKEALHIIAQKADGALRDALSIFDRIVSASGKQLKYEDVIANLNVLDYDYYFKIVDSFLMEDVGNVLLSYDEILKKGFDPEIFINGLAEHFRNLLVSKDEQTLPLLEVSESLGLKYKEQANNASTSFLLSALNIANDCDVNFKMARNKKLHAEMAIIKMCYINRAVNLSQQAPRVQPAAKAPEKKTPDTKSINPQQKKSTSNYTSAETPNNTSQPNPTKVENLKPTETTPSEPPSDPIKPVSENQDLPPIPPESKPSNKIGKLKSLGKKSKFDTFKISKLDELDEAVLNNDAAEEGTVSLLTQEALQTAWNKYLQTVSSNSVKATLQNADRLLKADEKKLLVTVGTQMAKSQLQQESDLMPYLREQLNTKTLALEIQIDSSKAISKNEPKHPKALTEKEKYLKLTEVNDLVHEMRKRFDLKIDKD